MKKIAFYGKGGIGKSTVSSNVSAALSLMGYKVMQIGCDPKADSTLLLTNGDPPTPVISFVRECGICSSLDDVVKKGFNEIVCVESGGPIPGIGCAGRGILQTFSVLEDLDAFNVYNPDYVFFDVLGDVVCGGFAMPIREGWADEVVLVTSGEKMSLYAARNIKNAIENLSERGYARLLGIVGNCRGINKEEEILRRFSREIGEDIVGIVPRDNEIGYWEEQNQTVIEGNSESPSAQAFFEIAKTLTKGAVET